MYLDLICINIQVILSSANLQLQFQAFMATIKSLSSKIEQEQTRKLQELSSSGPSNTSNGAGEFLSFGGIPGANTGSSGGDGDAFADLVFGKSKPSNGTSSPGWGGASSSNNDIGSSLGPAPLKKQETASFSWSTPSSATHSPPPSLRPQRAATPDSRFAPLTPSSPGIPPPLSSNNSMSMGMSSMGMGMGMGMGTLQPQPSPGFGSTTALRPQQLQQQQQQQQQNTQNNMGGMTIDWSSVAGTKKPTLSTAPLTPKPSTSTTNYGMGMGMGMNQTQTQTQNRSNGFPSPQPQQQQQQSHPTILYGQTRQQAAPAPQGTGAFAGFMIPPPPGSGSGGGMGMGGGGGGGMNLVIGSGVLTAKKQEKKGLDAWESLL